MFRRNAILAGLAVAAIMIAYIVLLPHRGWERNSSELTALTTALFWEGAISEPVKGLHAIAWVVLNRVESKDFPDTIREVVAEGVRPGRRSGCQFSFACDGEEETPRRLCELRPRDAAQMGFLGCERRWVRYLALAAWWLYVSPGSDPTNGAVLYYTGDTPYWAVDFVDGSMREIGNHTFGQSKWLGRDVARRK